MAVPQLKRVSGVSGIRSLSVVLPAAAALLACSQETPMHGSSAARTPNQSVDQQSAYSRNWPSGPALFRLQEDLVLAIPPQFQKFWLQHQPVTGRDLVKRPPTPAAQAPLVNSIGFSFHLPDFSGYTPGNYQIELDPTRVDVVSLRAADIAAAAKGAPGGLPANAMNRLLQYGVVDDSFNEMYGLRCHRMRNRSSEAVCYGTRDSDPAEDIILDVSLPPYDGSTQFPLMQATYFTPRYGGLEITWRAHMNNFGEWRQIDAQIWRFIDSWNVAPRRSPSR